jgi:hypothetical protein
MVPVLPIQKRAISEARNADDPEILDEGDDPGHHRAEQARTGKADRQHRQDEQRRAGEAEHRLLEDGGGRQHAGRDHQGSVSHLIFFERNGGRG